MEELTARMEELTARFKIGDGLTNNLRRRTPFSYGVKVHKT